MPLFSFIKIARQGLILLIEKARVSSEWVWSALESLLSGRCLDRAAAAGRRVSKADAPLPLQNAHTFFDIPNFESKKKITFKDVGTTFPVALTQSKSALSM